jgi:hypothetical protein
MLDPAIVSGQMAHTDRNPTGNPMGGQQHTDMGGPRGGGLENQLGRHAMPEPRAESPPAWITANLEQLTAEPSPYNPQASLIPAFNGLGLGLGGQRGSNGLGGVRSGGGGLWNPATAAPPPGFTHHRGGQLQPHYPGFGISKNSEAQKIGDF